MTPLEQAWEHYGGQLPTRGQKARCPLHEDREASAVVNLETGRWKCFAGCGRGDIYELIGLAEGRPDFKDQLRVAKEKFGADGTSGARPKNKKRPGRKGGWVPPWLRN